MTKRPGAKPHRGIFPTDLLLVGILGLWIVVSALGQLELSTGRMALGLVAVLFAPGYALVAALFPQRYSGGILSRSTGSATQDGGEITAVERFVLAVGLSVCLVPLIGLGMEYAPGAILASTFVATIGVTTILLTLVAAIRRARVPPQERFSPGIIGSLRKTGGQLKTLRAESNLTLLLVIGLVVAAGGISFAVVGADRGEQFTEFYLATEDPESGEVVAGEYPDEIPRDEAETVQVGITNKEGETIEYTVVVLLQSFDGGQDIREVQRLDTFSVTLQNGESVREPHTIRPEMTGEDLRVTYLLYIGSPPEGTVPRTENAYRHVHIWIDVPPE